ncbi:hypothetical protein MTP99_016562 [Tenebrio molitor]|nr:hypothetical protein MTP99_016562 [Tenebrio molitor]
MQTGNDILDPVLLSAHLAYCWFHNQLPREILILLKSERNEGVKLFKLSRRVAKSGDIKRDSKLSTLNPKRFARFARRILGPERQIWSENKNWGTVQAVQVVSHPEGSTFVTSSKGYRHGQKMQNNCLLVVDETP